MINFFGLYSESGDGKVNPFLGVICLDFHEKIDDHEPYKYHVLTPADMGSSG